MNTASITRTLFATTCFVLFSYPALSQSSTEPGRRDRDRDLRELEELLRDVGDERSSGPSRRGFGFLLRSGDAMIVARCDPRESMKACVEATTTLLEKARSMTPGATTPPGR